MALVLRGMSIRSLRLNSVYRSGKEEFLREGRPIPEKIRHDSALKLYRKLGDLLAITNIVLSI